ncbi:DedA family protein [Parendozoicomonas haliclonae]|uniref:SNARE associated Golgi protein n=1 Tax=Parendozoicomonas haliclonae TaxID=1960125 RepID=A0A1X7APP9_9GAMM|nr:VTT domain-containing protein [Parendozoicomonas haliclonae]SMA50266.1 SNARE associated Golgi protein [Parendozoicomonas haliclonae]
MDGMIFFEGYLFSSPVLLWMALFLGTFVLEDAAIVAGVMLVLQEGISEFGGFSALLLGIVVGDILLYTLGAWSSSLKLLQHWKQKHASQKIGGWLKENALLTILLVRFAPGLRLPCYLSCGWFSIPLKVFILGVSVAGCLWMLLVYGGLLYGGKNLWNSSQAALWLNKFGIDPDIGKWVLLPLVAAVLYMMQWCMKFAIRAYLERRNAGKQG